MKLLAALLKTKTRILIALTLCTTLMGLFLTWAVPWMEESSSSIGTNLFVIIGWMLLGTIIAFFVSILVGDQMFGEGWRSQMFDHAHLDLGESDLELGMLAKKMRVRTFQFSILYTFCAVFVLLTSNYASGDFFGHYQKVSYYKTIFRGDKIDLKVEALKTLGESWGPELTARTPIVLLVLKESKNPTLKGKALEALTGIAYTVRGAANPRARSSASSVPQWKKTVAELIREEAATDIRALLASSKNPEERSLAWLILASVAPKALLVEAAAREKRPLGEDDRATLVLGLNWRGGDASLKILRAELDNDRAPRTRIAAMWALGNFLHDYEAPPGHDGEPEPHVQAILDQIKGGLSAESLDLRCAALVSLGKAGDLRLFDAFLSMLEKSGPEDKCTTQEIPIPGRRPQLIYRTESIRFRALEAIAYITRGNKRAIQTLETIIGEPDKYSARFREQVRDVLQRSRAR